jgi:hypothetical protein
MSDRRRWNAPRAIRDRIEGEVAAAQQSNDPWPHLERAHVLAQPWIRPHLAVHVAMLGRGVRERDRHEIVGQLIRLIVAGPGSATGKYPTGNTGRSNVSMTQPMPIPDDLQRILESAS